MPPNPCTRSRWSQEGAPEEGDTLDVTPPEMTVRAAVEVGYAIADPAAHG